MPTGPRPNSPLVSSPPGFSALNKVLAPAFYEKDTMTGLPTGRVFDEQGNDLSVVTAPTDPVTGGISLSTGGAVHKTGRAYTTINLPLNQSGNQSVLPTDYSDNAVVSGFGASVANPWGWPGYFTATPNAANVALKPAVGHATVDLSTDSFIVGFTLVKPITGGADLIAGATNTTTPGLAVIVGTTGLLGPRMYCAAGAAFSAKYGTTIVGGGAVGCTTNSAGYAIGATTITLASAGSGALTAGEQIQFGTDPNYYTVSTGDADVSGGGTVVIPAPGLLKAIPAAATPITIVSGGRVHRCMWAWDAPTATIYQYVDGVLDFSMASDKTIVAGETQSLGWWLGQCNLGTSFLSQFAGFQFLTFADSSLPINMAELATQDNLKRRTGLMDVPVFL